LSVTPVEPSSLFGTPALASGPTTTTAGQDKELFLQLLVAQMRYQDPMNPTDSGEFLAQSAQFTALEKMQLVADQTAQLVALQVAFGASAMVGRTVSYPGSDGTTTSGVVTGVRFESTGPVLQVNGEDIHLAAVLGVTDGGLGPALTQPPTQPPAQPPTQPPADGEAV
jgi:flagellar basal-body rod modification protein FlgD